MDISLVILAAGIGSRYQGGIKQIARVDKNAYTIIDYSVYDAIRAGFNKVVFIIRKDIEKDFKKVIGDRIAKKVDVEYAFQDMDLPQGFDTPKDRSKPWGTVDALLSAKDKIKGPFLVINADDYYGKTVYKDFYDFLVEKKDRLEVAMAGYKLKNTLSDNGTVNRGICKSDQRGNLLKIKEVHDIKKNPDGSLANKEGLSEDKVNMESLVSMNTWASDKRFLDLCQDYFIKFLKENEDDLLTAEYILSDLVASLIRDGKISVRVIPTSDRWIGITYKEDLKKAQEDFRQMIKNKDYPDDIWA